MDERHFIYNSRIIKIFLEYLDKFYPNLDINPALSSAEMTKYQVEDQAHWFSQEQVDRFHQCLVEITGNPNISREAGRYAVSAEAFGWMKQRILGLIQLTSIYQLMEKLYPVLSRGATVKANKLGPNKVEIISTPNPGVKEKQYQCENRMGSFESVSKLFTGKLATIEHPLCFHRGDEFCQYIITVESPPSLKWNRIRNYFLLGSIGVSLLLLLTLPVTTVGHILGAFGFIALGLTIYFQRLERNELRKTIAEQGDAAKDHLDEINKRYNNSLLIQEIGQAISTITSTEELAATVSSVMEKRLDFDRGSILLANRENTRLRFVAGYGYTEEQMIALRETQFRLDNPNSKGTLVEVFRQKEAVLLDDINKIKEQFSHRSGALVDLMNIKSILCVPIIYENDTLGVLTVDNIKTKKTLTQSDISLLSGVASQTAVSIINARSFQRIKDSEKKYRDLVENANSIILRVDVKGHVTFFNEFAQKFFNYSETEILGQNIIGTVFPQLEETTENFTMLVESLREDPEQHVVSENESILKNDDRAWITWTYKPIFKDRSNLMEILCIGSDTTQLRRAAQENKELEIQLQRAQKMEAIGTLAGGVAHDLNNILASIVSYPQLLLMKLPKSSDYKKPLEKIQKSGEKAATIVQDLLTLARRGVAVTEPANINEIFYEYLRSPEYENLVVNNAPFQIKTHIEKELMNVIGSSVHLSKTVMNLISNAVEAMPDGGTITVKTENKRLMKPVKGYSDVRQGDYAVLQVSDNGVGISPQNIERIFEPFYTKKKMGRSGTGLGMAVVWGTVQDHRGYIVVDSTVGKGTTVYPLLPCDHGSSTEKGAAPGGGACQ